MKQTEDDKTIDMFDNLMSIDEHQEDLEEAHYVHTINAFVELIVVYGWDKVTSDLRSAMGAKEW